MNKTDCGKTHEIKNEYIYPPFEFTPPDCASTFLISMARV